MYTTVCGNFPFFLWKSFDRWLFWHFWLLTLSCKSKRLSGKWILSTPKTLKSSQYFLGKVFDHRTIYVVDVPTIPFYHFLVAWNEVYWNRSIAHYVKSIYGLTITLLSSLTIFRTQSSSTTLQPYTGDIGLAIRSAYAYFVHV